MMDLEPLNKLLDKKMDRKEFLTHIGAVVVAVSGAAAIIKNLTEPRGRHRKTTKKAGKSSGYGQSPYGI